MSFLTKLANASDLETFLEKNKNEVVVLFFSANWSEESQLMSQVVDELGKDEKSAKLVRFMQIEAEDFEEISVKYGVDAVPTFVFFKNKVIVHKQSGADAAGLRKKLEELAKLTIPSPDLKTGPTRRNKGKSMHLKRVLFKSDLNTRLKNLINAAPIMLFMKGSPQEPRCGFSRQTIEILKNQGAEFGYFDILSDNDVREGLKKYSNWPTYPQLYINGDLIGGLDIIKELVQNNEFKDMLPKKDESLNEKLKKLVNRSKIMLFMKGNSKEPKCGFSRQIVEILNATGHKYDTFDILTDEEVRQGLKEYSNWPTYPQLYVDGELIGGLDIVKELKQNGELNETLKEK